MITVTLAKKVNGVEQKVEIPHLQILSIDEIQDWVVNAAGQERHQYVGTLIGSTNHSGWMVKERSAAIERQIEKLATKCYNYQCGDSCCGKNRMFPAQKGGRR